MKILIYIPQMWYCDYRFYKEIMYKHVPAGDTVHILKCRGAMKEACAIADKIAPQDAKTGCRGCMTQFYGLAYYQRIPDDAITYFTELPRLEKSLPDSFASVADLSDYYYKSADIGAAAANTLCNSLYDTNPELSSHQTEVRALLAAGAGLFDLADGIIRDYDLVYLFNGRPITLRPVSRACENRKIAVTTLEYGYCDETYKTASNPYTQHPRNFAETVVDHWSKGDSDRNKIGTDFYVRKREHSNRQHARFTCLQEKNLLPEGLDKKKHNLTIYDTTFLEILGMPEFKNVRLPFEHFQAIIAALALHCASRTDLNFYYRAHPLKSNVSYTATHRDDLFTTQARKLRCLNALRLPNLSVIWPHSPVDSYALLDASDTVITFGSAMGLEAAYWGKPHILLGKMGYSQLPDTCYQATTPQELSSLIGHLPLRPHAQTSALMYGYFIETYGLPFTAPLRWGWEDPQGERQMPPPVYTRPENPPSPKLKENAELAEAFFSASPEPKEMDEFRRNVEYFLKALRTAEAENG